MLRRKNKKTAFHVPWLDMLQLYLFQLIVDILSTKIIKNKLKRKNDATDFLEDLCGISKRLPM